MAWNLAEVLADGLPGKFGRIVAEMRGEGLRHPGGGGDIVVGDREAEEGLEVQVLG